MNTFEAARLKHAKNKERRERFEAVEPAVEPEPVVFIERTEAPKEKPMTDAFIEVRVSLPAGDFSFMLVKPAVAQNAVMSKLTKAAFVNGVMKGLEPLLGAVKEK